MQNNEDAIMDLEKASSLPVEEVKIPDEPVNTNE